MTIGEIAKLAGVSKTTVSRVLNNKPDVKPETRIKIMELIEQKNFHPNAFAKAISSQISNSLGLIIPYEAEYIFSNPFYVEVLRGVSTQANIMGYFLNVCYPHDQNYVDIYKQKRVDGFILISPGSKHLSIIDSLKQEGAPFVATARIPSEKDLTYVDVDNFAGGIMATEHLISLGHRRIGFIGKPTMTSSTDRFDGYKEALKKHHIEYDDNLVRVSETSSIEGGYLSVLELLEIRHKPTAIFLTNDLLALGALKAIDEKGLNVPGDISVVGFDDIPMADYVTPPLTTIRQPAYEKGVEASKILVNYLKNNKPLKSKMLSLELIVRKSTAACR
ncbi:MAG: LacI family DNA-binding transcriptional regulator [Bacillota bacterium]|nr:LacI family DNA-binding transcriptional regulator [Bacillota bacterium]MDW7677710.1 LacI family DNA-binding transcriptional regulator [Bacillota bacterium]